MNPNLPPDFHQDPEAMLTALLLGELTADEAATLRQRMAKDPALTRLHEQLKATLDLVGETAATPMGELSAPPTPLRLSAEKREVLLAQFKTVPLPVTAPPRKESRFWLVPLAAAAAIVLMAGVLMRPNFARWREVHKPGMYGRREVGFSDGLFDQPVAELLAAPTPTSPTDPLTISGNVWGGTLGGNEQKIPIQAPTKSDIYVGQGIAESSPSSGDGATLLAKNVTKDGLAANRAKDAATFFLSGAADIGDLQLHPGTERELNGRDEKKALGEKQTVQAEGKLGELDSSGAREKQPVTDLFAANGWAAGPSQQQNALGQRIQAGEQAQSSAIQSEPTRAGGAVGGTGLPGASAVPANLVPSLSPPVTFDVDPISGGLTHLTPEAGNKVANEPHFTLGSAGVGAGEGARGGQVGDKSQLETRQYHADLNTFIPGLQGTTLAVINGSGGTSGGGGGFGGGGSGEGIGSVQGGATYSPVANGLLANDARTAARTIVENSGKIVLPATTSSLATDGEALGRQKAERSAWGAQSEVDRFSLGAENLRDGVVKELEGAKTTWSFSDGKPTLRGYYDDEKGLPGQAFAVAPGAQSAPQNGPDETSLAYKFQFGNNFTAQTAARGNEPSASAGRRDLSLPAVRLDSEQDYGARLGLDLNKDAPNATPAPAFIPQSQVVAGSSTVSALGAISETGNLFSSKAKEMPARARMLNEASKVPVATGPALTEDFFDSKGEANRSHSITDKGSALVPDSLKGTPGSNQMVPGVVAPPSGISYLGQDQEGVPASAPRDALSILKPMAEAKQVADTNAPTVYFRLNGKLDASALREPAAKPAASAVLPKVSATTPTPQPEIQTRDNAFSTFSLNVSDVGFKLAAVSLQNGALPDSAGVRSEEFINAFDYRDSEPVPGAPIGFAWERAAYPFAHNRDLLRFSVKTTSLGRDSARPLNVVLLLDKSGSMERADRVAMIREALRVLAQQLQPQDKLSVVVFARTARLVADGVSGSQAAALAETLADVTPEGGTNLEEAMKLAYETAARHYLAQGENRVVLLTDGAANLGNVQPEALQNRVETNRTQGFALDCFGVGWEDYNDHLLELLARAGGGRYGFINTPEEAVTEFAGQLAGALRVAASDVKVQVEFNPNRVISYRQIGYAKDKLTKEQFRDNTVKAAQLGAAEAGNALYTVEINPAGEGPVGTVHVRYREPGTENYRERAWDVPYTGAAAPLDQSGPPMRLAAVASAFSEWLAASPFAGEVTPDQLLALMRGVPEAYGPDLRPKTLETMIREAKSISGQ